MHTNKQQKKNSYQDVKRSERSAGAPVQNLRTVSILHRTSIIHDQYIFTIPGTDQSLRPVRSARSSLPSPAPITVLPVRTPNGTRPQPKGTKFKLLLSFLRLGSVSPVRAGGPQGAPVGGEDGGRSGRPCDGLNVAQPLVEMG